MLGFSVRSGDKVEVYELSDRGWIGPDREVVKVLKEGFDPDTFPVVSSQDFPPGSAVVRAAAAAFGGELRGFPDPEAVSPEVTH